MIIKTKTAIVDTNTYDSFLSNTLKTTDYWQYTKTPRTLYLYIQPMIKNFLKNCWKIFISI